MLRHRVFAVLTAGLLGCQAYDRDLYRILTDGLSADAAMESGLPDTPTSGEAGADVGVDGPTDAGTDAGPGMDGHAPPMDSSMDVALLDGPPLPDALDAPVVDMATTETGADSGPDVAIGPDAIDTSPQTDTRPDVIVVTDSGGTLDGGPNVPAPRPLAPLSPTFVDSTLPTLRWLLPATDTGALVEICSDRSCSHIVTTVNANGSSTTLVPPALTPGVWYWRLRGVANGAIGTATSATWEFTVGHIDASADTSWTHAPDFNGDGYSDVLLGSGYGNTVLVAYGGATSMQSEQTLTGTGTVFGRAVAGVDDVNGDGFGDAVVGDPGYSNNAGAAHLFLGGPNGLTEALMVASPFAAGGAFGTTISSAGDVNGDGYGDVAVGAPNADSVAIYFGSATGMSPIPPQVLTGPMGSKFGWSLAGGGDINADHLPDLLIGAPMQGTTGVVSLFADTPNGFGTGASVTYQGSSGSQSGSGVAMADVTCDGIEDVLFIGSTGTNIYLSAGVTSGVPTSILMAPATGQTLANAGDINGDGCEDLVVGDPNYNAAAGRVQVYLGGQNPQITPVVTLQGTNTANEVYGFSVAGAGDVNGDQYADIVVGGYLTASSNYNGEAYLYIGAGNSTGLQTAPYRMWAGANGGELGYSVARWERVSVTGPVAMRGEILSPAERLY